jgi:hypothetical protein
VPPSQVDPGVTPEVDAVVLHALAKRTEDRYQTAADFRADVERAIAGSPVTAAVPMVTADRTQMMPPVQAAAAAGYEPMYDTERPRRRRGAGFWALSLVGVVAAHFHQGVVGVNGPIQIPLNGTGGNYCGVSSPLTAAQVAAWQANGIYVNVHTAANPGGEIRAQMLRDQGDHFVAAASAAQAASDVCATSSSSALTPGTDAAPSFTACATLRVCP